MTLHEFAGALDSLDAAGWDRLERLAVENDVGAYAWDSAWDRALSSGLASVGIALADRMPRYGSRTVRAAIAGAAAAIASDGQLDVDQREELLKPVREVIAGAASITVPGLQVPALVRSGPAAVEDRLLPRRAGPVQECHWPMNSWPATPTR
jgi:hypothetical protein